MQRSRCSQDGPQSRAHCSSTQAIGSSSGVYIYTYIYIYIYMALCTLLTKLRVTKLRIYITRCVHYSLSYVCTLSTKSRIVWLKLRCVYIYIYIYICIYIFIYITRCVHYSLSYALCGNLPPSFALCDALCDKTMCGKTHTLCALCHALCDKTLCDKTHCDKSVSRLPHYFDRAEVWDSLSMTQWASSRYMYICKLSCLYSPPHSVFLCDTVDGSGCQGWNFLLWFRESGYVRGRDMGVEWGWGVGGK